MLDPSNLTGTGFVSGAAAMLGNGLSGTTANDSIADLTEVESRAIALAAAIEMLSSLDRAEDLDRAFELSTYLLGDLLGATRVLLLWRQHPDGVLSVVSDTDTVAAENDQARSHRLATAAGEETVARNEITVWPAESVTEAHALMAMKQLAKSISAQRLISFCLLDAEETACGVVILIDSFKPNAERLVDAISEPLAGKLLALRRLQPSKVEQVMRNLKRCLTGPRRKTILSGIAATVFLLMLPLPYKVRTDIELQPVKRRFVAVPFDGSLDSAFVRPGDTVQQGDLLASIDPREIEYQLASIRAELKRADHEKKGLMAVHDFAGSKIAALESERLRLETDLLIFQRDNLEIRSPISGVVVSGDLKQSEGMPMSRGDSLFEIAPLGRMVVEIAIPEVDIAHVTQGMPVSLYVHARPNHVRSGSIERIHPKSELREHRNVFVAEVQITDPEGVLRPGMRGQATITTRRHTLAWNLFHKAFYAMRRTLGW